MNDYPTAGVYQEVLQSPEIAFVDPELREAKFEENALGLPRAISGAFAVVFPMYAPDGRKLAVKCFLTDVPDQRSRYRALSGFLTRYEIPAIAGFEYQDRGIHVNGRVLPLLKMEWIEGTPLDRYVAQRLHRPDLLEHLARLWTDLLAVLAKVGIAHGDLHHENVVIIEEPDHLGIRLIDYDTMYVPGFGARKASDIGHRNFQHPDRDTGDFGPEMDHFPGLVILTSLKACAARPDLWERYHTGSNLLFRAEDFKDPRQSPLFRELDQIESVRLLATVLQNACYQEPKEVPAPSEVLERSFIEPLRSTALDAVRRKTTTSVQRSFLEMIFLPSLLTGLGFSLLLFLAGFGSVAVGSMVVIILAFVGWSFSVYQRRSEVRRRKRLVRQGDYLDAIIHRLEEEIDQLVRERDRVTVDLERIRSQRIAAIQKQLLDAHLKQHFVSEVEGFEGISHKNTVRLKAAGIRNAYLISSESLERVKEIGDSTREAILRWRKSIVDRYADTLPEHLPESEEERLAKVIKQSHKDIQGTLDRLQEKVNVRRDEKQDLDYRLAGIPELTYFQYLRFLLRLSPLPS